MYSDLHACVLLLEFFFNAIQGIFYVSNNTKKKKLRHNIKYKSIENSYFVATIKLHPQCLDKA